MIQSLWADTYSPEAGGEWGGRSYWIATYGWENQNYPFSVPLYSQSGGFGTGYVPTFGVIGKDNVVYYNDSGYNQNAVMQAIRDAVNSFPPPANPFVILENPIADQVVNFSETLDLDLSSVFSIEGGAAITMTVDENTNSDIATATINGNTLTVVAGSVQGTTQITVRGVVGERFAIDRFMVEVKDPDLVLLYSENFEAEPTDWTYTNTDLGWKWGAVSDFAASNYWSFASPLTGAKFMGINSDGAGEGVTVHDHLISPVIDLFNKINLTITLDYCVFDDGTANYDSDMKLLYRTSASGEWLEVKSYNDLKQRAWLTDEDIVVPVEAQTATTQFAVEYDDFGHYAYGAGIDNFKINGKENDGIDSNPGVARNFELLQNYPNPFNPATSISFNLNDAASVKLSVFNAKGEKVANLVNDKLSQGAHKVNFNAANLNSGVYYYTLETSAGKMTKKMLLVK